LATPAKLTHSFGATRRQLFRVFVHLNRQKWIVS